MLETRNLDNELKMYMDQYSKEVINANKNIKEKSKVKTHSADTAAWAESYKIIPDSNVTIPSVENVIDAKDWVDNGSKL